MKEVRLALLDADVSYSVVKDFVAKITERAVGQSRFLWHSAPRAEKSAPG